MMKFWLKAFLVLAMMISCVVLPTSAAETSKKLSVKLSFSPSKKVYDLGETIRIEAESAKKSDQFTAKLLISDIAENEIAVSNEIETKKIVTNGSFTPKKAGTYKIQYEISTVDAKGQSWLGKAEKTVKVEGAPISVTVSPSTASMKLGDDLYILVKYPTAQIDQQVPTTIKTSHEDLLDEVSFQVPGQAGYYQKLMKFTPTKSGSYKISFNVNNETKDGEATASINVKK